MEYEKAPFTEEQVAAINNYQKNAPFHPFTCCGHACDRSEREDEGLLIATLDGLVCPCGKWTQDWVHDFMTQTFKSAKEMFNL